VNWLVQTEGQRRLLDKNACRLIILYGLQPKLVFLDFSDTNRNDYYQVQLSGSAELPIRRRCDHICASRIVVGSCARDESELKLAIKTYSSLEETPTDE
jgi:hypothetical protein